MKQKVKLAQNRNVGEIIDDSILFFKQNFKALFKSYFAICGIFWVTGIIVAVFGETKTFQLQEQGESIFSASYFLSLLFSFINFTLTLLTTLSFIKFYLDKGDETPTVEEVWGYVKYYLMRVFGTTVLLTILLAIGLVLCVIPGIYLFPVILLIITAMIMENADLVYAFNRGFQLLRNEWWNMVGVLIVMLIITVSIITVAIIPVMIIVAAILYLTNANHSQTIGMAIAVTLHALQFLYVLPAIAIALVYFNLNEKTSDNSLIKRIEMLGKTVEDTDQPSAEDY